MVPFRVLSRTNLAYSSRQSSLNSRPFNLLQPLCSLQKSQLLWNQGNPASFCKTPGVGVPSQIAFVESATSGLFFPALFAILPTRQPSKLRAVAKFFRIRSYAKCGRKPFRIRSYEKHRGVGASLTVLSIDPAPCRGATSSVPAFHGSRAARHGSLLSCSVLRACIHEPC